MTGNDFFLQLDVLSFASRSFEFELLVRQVVIQVEAPKTNRKRASDVALVCLVVVGIDVL